MSGFADALGRHILPGIVMVVSSAALLLVWEVMRFGWGGSARWRWLFAFSGITLGVLALALMVVRFLVID
jgi:hypothetical protein